MSGTILAAVSPDWVIGRDGGIPWHYSGDLQRFKRLTLGHTIIMGRRTWESLPRKPLPGRRNLVLTSRPHDGVECFATLAEAVLAPDAVPVEGSVLFPRIPDGWVAGAVELHPDEPALRLQRWRRG